ncbi:P-loop containing nucleoside triphosphate hydrolase protein [Dipodascopsis tothii]|uniref:P-loop containing nucleoside triphosphate hydrolase protein n=1 Tax=Dipodascopsis tothii TaxID=44089 RepID=UPI0034CF8304
MVSHYEVGVRCWQPDDDEGWISAEITSKTVDGDNVTLELTSEDGKKNTVICTVSDLEDETNSKLPPLCNPPILEASEDLTNLSYLNEPAILHAIRLRYSQLSIYTYSGIVLIATNPFQKVDSLYSPDIIQMYSGKRRGELEPHLFAIAEDAYRCMIRDKVNQTIVVSGESGAGKTVSAKYIMRYFAIVEDADRPRAKAHKADSLSKTEEQILATNPIMEAFGNAKTTRNDNSSRFGKYIEIMFDNNADIIGAKIRTYLLERSRLVFQPATERNYHIFYQLCCGATSEERDKWSLLSVSDFQYLNQGGDPSIANVDDSVEFRLTKEALKTIGFDEAVQSDIFAVLSALLHIGNIVISAGRTDAILAADEPSLATACKLLGIEPTLFAKWTTKKQITTRSEKIVTNLNFKQAVVVRDSVSKFVYSALFTWLVGHINKSLASEEVEAASESFIGVLDIYGFEHFQRNSFEQFCINYANEKLQQEFNQHVFKLEQDEYVREKIQWTFIDFYDNQPCIDLIEAKIGILSLLDEESRLPAGSDESWVQKLYTNFAVPKHEKFFKKPRFGKTAFTVHHYAMDVTYDSEGFIEKNRDTVPDEHMEVLLATNNGFLKELVESVTTAAPKPATTQPKSRPGALTNRKPTLGSIFKGSLIELMSTINSTNVHYIRCIKPNEAKAAWQFEGPMVLSQLRACGVLETIRISCEGFPTRWTFEEFISRYYMLINSSNWTRSIEDISHTILSETIKQPDKYQIGATKIFFRAGMLAYLENLRSQRLNDCATVIQKHLRGLYYRRQYQETRNSIVRAQCIARGFIVRRRVVQEIENAAALKIQSAWRGYVAKKQYLSVRSGIIKAQAAIRGRISRQRLLQGRRTDAAVAIQRVYRGYQARKSYSDTRRKIVLVQSCFRRKQARTELNTLRVEARSANHFKEISYKLENKVVTLTQTLTARTQENKRLVAQIDQLDNQILQWQQKNNQLEQQLHEMEEDDNSKEYLEKATQLETQLNELTEKYDASLVKLDALEAESKSLKESLKLKSLELDEALSGKQEKEQLNTSLSEEVERLREEISVLSTKSPASAPAASTGGLNINGVWAGGDQPQGGSHNLVSLQSKRTRSYKRHSLTQANLTADTQKSFSPTPNFSPRPASMIFTSTNSGVGGKSENGITLPPLNLDVEIETILDNADIVNVEVLQGLITTLKIPQPSVDNTPNEILFPAHIINLITSEMWRLGFVKESEMLLAMVMETIQRQVMSHDGEDAIIPGAFWLSNVHEMLSFVFLAETNIIQSGAHAEMGANEFQEYERLVGLVKHDLENLEFNIYHTWMKELKKQMHKMIIPALIESQALPGFVANENTRFFTKILNTATAHHYDMDDLLKLFNKIYSAMSAYYLESSIIHQAILELLRLVGVTAFNDLLSRRNFLSWKRGLQISYNITRVEEWCKSNDIPEGTLKLEHLMQATKLLQLKKSTLTDIEIIYDICWTLSPMQIQKLISQYHVADYEQPITPDIMKEIATRAVSDKDDTLLLESVPLEDSGPFELVEPRQLHALETYIPSWLQVPTLKRLADLTSQYTSAN